MELNLQMRKKEKQLEALDFSSTFPALQTCFSEISASATGHWSSRKAPMRMETTAILFSALPLACCLILGKISSLTLFSPYIKQEEINFTVFVDCFQIFWWKVLLKNYSVYHWLHEHYWTCNNLSSPVSVWDAEENYLVSSFLIAFPSTQDPRPLMLSSRCFS